MYVTNFKIKILNDLLALSPTIFMATNASLKCMANAPTIKYFYTQEFI